MKRMSGRGSSASSTGFSLIELLTVVGVIGVLATLLASGLASSKTRGQQAACSANLRQISMGVTVYLDETGRRPRSLTRLALRASGLCPSNIFLCPGDPALHRARPAGQPLEAWGNVASPAQEPPYTDEMGEPEAGNWQAELAEKQESVPFSYLHPLAWPRKAWQALAAQGGQAGDVACQLHGVRVPPGSGSNDRPRYMDYEGRTLRGQRDGAVVTRKIFFDMALPPGSASNAPRPRQSYPWDFYTDTPPSRL